MNTIFRFLLVGALVIFIGFSVAQTTYAEILMEMDVGNSWDWLTGAMPLFVHQGQMKWWNVITVKNNPFSQSALNGPVQLRVACCMDMFTRAAVTPSGLYLDVLPISGCRFTGSGPVLTLVCLQSLGRVGATVGVTPDVPGSALLVASASTNAVPGDFIATLTADSALGRSSREFFISVLPAAYPADGPAPACLPTLPVIPLASVKPDPFTWKSNNANKTAMATGIRFVGELVETGLQLTTVGGPAPLPRNVATVTFKNTEGWPVGIRTVNSASCGSPGPQFIAPAGVTVTIPINRATTTTLVFSRSICRAWIDWLDCWGGRGLGLDDILIFSEGSFWTLFGGRTVNIETVGNWGAVPRPNSIITIRTP